MGNQQAHSGGHSRVRRTFQKGQKYETSWMFLPMQNILQFTLQQALVSVYQCSTFFPCWRHKGPNLYIHSFRNKWITSTMYQSFRSWSVGLWVINMIAVGPVKQMKLRNMKRGCECLLVRTTNLGRRQLSWMVMSVCREKQGQVRRHPKNHQVAQRRRGWFRLRQSIHRKRAY